MSKRKINYGKFIPRVTLIICIILLCIFMPKLLKKNNSILPGKSEKAEISLKGEDTIYLYRNEEYKEDGFSAKTLNGKDISKEIKVENNIDTTKEGEYEITYSLDSDGYVSETKTRKVVVKKPKILNKKEKSKNKLPVLMYHYFYDKSKGEKGENSNWMEISKFEEQIKYLVDNDYYFPDWQEVSDFVDGKIDLPKKSIAITIDDGQKSLYNLAIPVLDKYKVKATAFIITSKLKTGKLEKYKDSYIDFESHSDNMHRGGANEGHGGIFQVLSIDEGVKDLKTSVEKLRRK